MTKHFVRTLSLMVLFALVGCASNSKKNSGGDSLADAAKNVNVELNGSSDENTAGPLKTVYFAFDSSALSSSARNTLEMNAEFLKRIEAVNIQIEGHADERGGHQYNLALGNRRAEVIKDYLMALGVSGDRITVISYGKEKPVAFGHDEDAWSQNRRGNFVITAK